MTNSEFKTISIQKDAGITTLMFNRPEKRNCMSPTLHREMLAALSELEYDEETKVLVITGNGEAFCAGQDLKEYFYELKDDPKASDQIHRISHEWRFRKLNYFPKPTIAAINGWCFGGAFTVVASCDIVVAAEEAVFGLSEVNFGMIPGGLVTRVVADHFSRRQALYYILTGETFNGQKAEEIGFATMAVPKDKLMDKVHEIARTLASKEPHTLKACKEAFKCGVNNLYYDDAWEYLQAKTKELTLIQKGTWIDQGIGKFMEGKYRPGLESFTNVDSQG